MGARITLLALLSLTACAREGESIPVAVHAVPGAAPQLASDIQLELRAASRVDVGDDLKLELRVRNESDQVITLVRPIYGSWELARSPRYELVWTDERGQAIADPLGFAPGLECGTLDPITRADFIRVEPGAGADVGNGPSARTSHAVLPSARPGRYSLQVRYLAQGIDGASELQVLSEPVAVEIVGGDAGKWSCRAEQLAAAANHEWVTASPVGLIADADGAWLIASSYRHRVVEHEPQHLGEVWAQRLDGDLRPVGDPQELRTGGELGWISVVEREGGWTLVATPGEVGQRWIDAWTVSLVDGLPRATEPKLVQAGPGNPYVTRTLARADRTAILHEGGEAGAGALLLTFVDHSATRIGHSHRVAAMATDFELLAVGAEDVVAVWAERGEVDGGVLQRFDAGGEAVGAAVRFELDPSHSFAGARLDAGALELAWVDSGTRGDDPSDMLGLYVRRFSTTDGRALGPARALTPESRTEARFGDVAWHGDRLARLVSLGNELSFGVTGDPLRTVSSTAEGGERLFVETDGYVALWTDIRDDASNACARLEDCVAEIYGARFDPSGAQRGPAQRLTGAARAKPFVPSAFDWQQHCP